MKYFHVLKRIYFFNTLIMPVCLFFVYTLMLVFSSCSRNSYLNKPTYQFKSIHGEPDYSDLNSWSAHPGKQNPSDSVPKPLRKDKRAEKTVDVFFIYPTTFVNMSDPRWNAPIDDPEINVKTDYSSTLYQASVFNESCRIFSPRYRQANLKVFFDPDSAKSASALDLAYNDIVSAFTYYLQHYNQGRPIIIASHSQGTVHAGRLMKDFFENKLLQNKLVCAYLIGMPVPENYFTGIQPCKDSTSTGCFVSWRTFKRGYIEPTHIAKETFKAVVINPLTWTQDQARAPRKLNTGSVLKRFNKIIPHSVNAQIHNNVLWTCRPHFFGNIFLVNKNYHVGDINLFYKNIRTNVATRIDNYQKQKRLN
jgi:hypothetical protein